ncbi:MAG: ATP synthase delta/epsilon chain alpha-helix domain-containing protein [Spirochaetia bacterium]|jgi:F-type H+-transporting ATPase subunit epsilon
MAEELFFLRVLSPLGTAFAGQARSATLPTMEGEITVLAQHMPMVAVLVDGEMLIDTGEKVISIAIAGGFLDTGGAAAGHAADGEAATAPGHAADGEAATAPGPWEATVLSDFAAQSDSIEIARVEAAKARAEQLLEEKKERGELLLVERDLQRAILQLKVAEKARARRRS